MTKLALAFTAAVLVTAGAVAPAAAQNFTNYPSYNYTADAGNAPRWQNQAAPAYQGSLSYAPATQQRQQPLRTLPRVENNTTNR